MLQLLTRMLVDRQNTVYQEISAFIKDSREKISRSKIFTVWDFHENLTRGENMEEYGRD